MSTDHNRCVGCGVEIRGAGFCGTLVGDDAQSVCSAGCAAKAWAAERAESYRLRDRVRELDARVAAEVDERELQAAGWAGARAQLDALVEAERARAARMPRSEALAIIHRLTQPTTPEWPTHKSNGWDLTPVGGPFRDDAPTWIRVMCEPEHLAPGDSLLLQTQRFAAWLAGFGYAMVRVGSLHPACFCMVPGRVDVAVASGGCDEQRR